MEEKKDNLAIIFFVFLTSLILPLLLIPVEKIIPHPYVIEEIVKAVLIIIILKTAKHQHQLTLVLITTFLFAFSENIFYLSNFIAGGILISFWQRCLLTTTLHTLTAVIILLPSQKKVELVVPATIFAIIIHYFYNQLVLSLF